MVFPKEPETYYLDPTPYVPNSKLPVLIYRNCLGESPTAASLKTQIEPNRWLKGGQWKAYLTAHYHSITHECYAVFAGRSDILLGRSPVDDKDVPGVKVELGKGDIIVLPVSSKQDLLIPMNLIDMNPKAGVSHHSVGDYTDDYEYCGFYPEVRTPSDIRKAALI